MESMVFSVLNNILEEMHDGISITDGEGIILQIGKTCRNIYGIEEQSYVGQHVSVLEDIGLFSPSVALKVLESRERVTITQPDRHGQKLLVTGVPIFDDERKNILYVISYASWDSANVRQLQAHYEQLQKEIQRSNQEIKAMRKNLLSVELVAGSEKMKKVRQLADKVAEIDLQLLVVGDKGTGKSILAKYIHTRSPRAKNPFVKMSCSAFPGQILGDELFGYVKINQATGEETEKIGLCEVSDSGTLFLEDIDCMSWEIQGSLLYLIENGCYFKTNSKEVKHVNVRVIASTKRDLSEQVRRGKFREELYYRLNVATIRIPRLKERAEDLPILTDLFLQNAMAKHGKKVVLSRQVREMFSLYDWPGNVRELKYLVEQLVFSVEDEVIQSYHLPGNISPFSSENYGATIDLKEYMDYYEGRLILQVYEKCKTTVKLAQYLGISQASAVRKLQKYKKLISDGDGD